jgi:hypothetical protein
MADQVIDLDVSATSIYIFTLVLDSASIRKISDQEYP